jgi:hypothetical protein
MGRISGMKEKLHMPLYDAFVVAAGQTVQQALAAQRNQQTVRYFVDLQNKSRLETNLQSAGQLPSQNTYEARALRVVLSRVPDYQIGGAGAVFTTQDFLGDLIFNSVTTLLVGEKVMMEMPTFYFPAGAGVVSAAGALATHGEPDPMATFRFSEPVTIEPQQAFRVDLTFPNIPARAAAAGGEFRLWMVLDGYLTRDVQ